MRMKFFLIVVSFQAASASCYIFGLNSSASAVTRTLYITELK